MFWLTGLYPCCKIAGDQLSRTSFLTCACTISICSEGSWWHHGRNETCLVCEGVRGKLSKDSADSLSVKSTGATICPDSASAKSPEETRHCPRPEKHNLFGCT
jgi:hypothetical protein